MRCFEWRWLDKFQPPLLIWLIALAWPHLLRAQPSNPVASAAFRAAADYSRSQGGASVLVMRQGEIVFEDYAPGWDAAKPHLLASGTT